MGSGASRASPGSRAPRASSRPARTPLPRPPGSTPAARPERRQAAPTRPPPAGARQLSAVVVRRGGRRVDRREQREAGGGRFLPEIPRWRRVWRATFGCRSESSNQSKAVMALVDHCRCASVSKTAGREHNRHCGRAAKGRERNTVGTAETQRKAPAAAPLVGGSKACSAVHTRLGAAPPGVEVGACRGPGSRSTGSRASRCCSSSSPGPSPSGR